MDQRTTKRWTLYWETSEKDPLDLGLSVLSSGGMMQSFDSYGDLKRFIRSEGIPKGKIVKIFKEKYKKTIISRWDSWEAWVPYGERNIIYDRKKWSKNGK